MKKQNALFGIGLSILFVILGYYLAFIKSNQPDVSAPELLKIGGYICMVFFGAFSIFGIVSLVKNSK